MGEASPWCAPCQVLGGTPRQGNLQKLPSTACIQGLLKLEQIANNIFMFALSLSSETVSNFYLHNILGIFHITFCI